MKKPRIGTSFSKENNFYSLALLGISMFITFLIWAISSPAGSSPDDDFHLPSIWCTSLTKADTCTGQGKNREIPSSLSGGMKCFAANGFESARCQSKTNWDVTETIISDHGNWIDQYPNGFYVFMSIFKSAEIVQSIIIMRFANSLLLTLLILLTYASVKTSVGFVFLITQISTAIGLTLFLIPSTNPSSWAICGTLCSMTLMYSYVRNDISREKTALFATIFSLIIATQARFDASTFLVFGFGMLILVYWKEIFLTRKIVAAASVATYFVFVLLSRPAQSNVALTGFGALNIDRPESVSLWINLQNIPTLYVGSFGYWGLGWLDTALPIGVWLPVSLIIFGLVWSQIPNLDFKQVLVALGFVSALLFIPLWVLSRTNLIIGEAIQPRYLLPLFIMSIFSLLYGNRELKFSRGQKVVFVAFLVIAHALALNIQLRRYLTGQDYLGVNLDTNREWWWSIPITPNMVWGIGTITFGFWAFALMKLQPKLVNLERTLDNSDHRLSGANS